MRLYKIKIYIKSEGVFIATYKLLSKFWFILIKEPQPTAECKNNIFKGSGFKILCYLRKYFNNVRYRFMIFMRHKLIKYLKIFKIFLITWTEYIKVKKFTFQKYIYIYDVFEFSAFWFFFFFCFSHQSSYTDTDCINNQLSKVSE